MRYLIVFGLTLASLSLVAESHARNYLSGYSSGQGRGNYLSGSDRPGSSSYSIHLNGRGYVSKFGSHGNIVRQHNGEYQRLKEERAAERARLQELNANPPCGNYGRMPVRCKTGALNIAERTY